MEKFEIICKECGSKKVDFEIGMGQGLGYIVIECLNEDCKAEETAVQDH